MLPSLSINRSEDCELRALASTMEVREDYFTGESLENVIDRIKEGVVDSSKQLIRKRLAKHMEFVVHRLKTKSGFKHENKHYGFPVMTAQEKELILNDPLDITQPEGGEFEVNYSDKPQSEFCKNWSDELKENKLDVISQNLRHAVTVKNSAQMELF